MSFIPSVNSVHPLALETKVCLPSHAFYRNHYVTNFLSAEKSSVPQTSLPAPHTAHDREIFQTFFTDFSDFLITQRLNKSTLHGWAQQVLKLLKDSCLRLNFQKQHLQDKLDNLSREKTKLRGDLAFALSSMTRALINNAYAAHTKDLEGAQKELDLISAKAANLIYQAESLEKYLQGTSQLPPQFLLALAKEAKYNLSLSLASQV